MRMALSRCVRVARADPLLHRDSPARTLSQLCARPRRSLLALWGERDDANHEVAATRRLPLLHTRFADSACSWAAWADALPVLRAWHPDAAARCLAELIVCLRTAPEAADPRDLPELGECAKAGSITVPALALPISTRLLPALQSPTQAMLRSQSRPCQACRHIPARLERLEPPCRPTACSKPCDDGCGFSFQCGAHGPGCGAAVDEHGDHQELCH